MSYLDIRTEAIGDGVVLITIDRAQVKNALRTQLLGELADMLKKATTDESVRCVVITGAGEHFAAGADIKEMAAKDGAALKTDPRVDYWQTISDFPKPIVAAVNGYCLGGGCELAMHADIIVAGNKAQFGQPEINLGIIPGAGGTQRLARCVGQSLAAQMVLSGKFISASSAQQAGLVAETCEDELTLERAISIAKIIATKAPLAVQKAKAMLKQALETPLREGLQYERRAFLELANTEDRNEGIAAFLEKRAPVFKGK